MGLAERRAIAKLQTETLPQIQSELDAIVGSHLELTVDWDSLATLDVEIIERRVPNEGLAEIVKALGSVCRDDLGKDAVREGVQKVQLRVPTREEDNALLFENKVLTILMGDPSYGVWRYEKIAEFLESKI